MPTPLNVINDARIAHPCPASWADMAGDDRRRHCGRCDGNVFHCRS